MKTYTEVRKVELRQVTNHQELFISIGRENVLLNVHLVAICTNEILKFQVGENIFLFGRKKLSPVEILSIEMGGLLVFNLANNDRDKGKNGKLNLGRIVKIEI